MAKPSLTSISTLTGVVRVDKKLLGSGSYGQVFAVKHGGKTYAAKQIHSVLLEAVSPEEEQAVTDSFIKECYQCSTLYHPNIVQFIGVYWSGSNSLLPNMVMELMDTSLKEYVKTPSISMKLKISILHDISQGLSFLHNRISPIVHRDLSPNNILLSLDSVAKISDLGVAKVVKVDSKRTQAKLTKAPGTIHFMPPEALTDNPAYSTSLDIFSYGGLVLHVVNQEWPEPNGLIKYDKEMKPVKMLTEIERRQKYLDVMTADAKVLKSLVVSCLHNDPTKRPTTANVLKMLKGLKLCVESMGHGSTDDSFQYQIKCARECGLFVPMDKMTLGKSKTLPRKDQLKQQPSVTDDKPFKMNDRVDDFDVSEKGTAKGIGSTKETLPRRRHTDGTVRPRIDKRSIGTPQDFQHTGHVESNNFGSDAQAPKPRIDKRLISPPQNFKLTAIRDQMHSKGGYEHSVHVPAEATPSGQDISTLYQVNPDTKSKFHTVSSMNHQALEIAGCETTRREPRKVQRSVSESESQSRVSGYEYQQTTFQQSTCLPLQGIHSQGIFQHGVHQQGMPQQDMHSQGDYQQGWPHQGVYPQQAYQSQERASQQYMHPQGLHPQDVNKSTMLQPDQDQRNAPQYYQSQQCNYQMERRHSIDFHLTFQAENVPNNTSEPYRQMELSHNVPRLEIGDAVQSNSNPISYGTIKWIGEFLGSHEKIAGVEKEESVADATDGWHDGYQYFMCEHGKGVFLPLAALRRDDRFIDFGQTETQNQRQDSTKFHQDLQAKPNVPNNTSEPYRQMKVSCNMPPLEVGDAVQSGSNPISYGTIKWIGEFSGFHEEIAGIEMEEPVIGATDGWHDGFQYFICERGKGMFLHLAALRRDDRFIDVKGQIEAQNPLGKFNLNNSIQFKTFPQPSEKVIEHMHTGRGKGIQGHQNSCYIDSTLYGLFAFSDAFDDLFLKQVSDEIGRTIQSTLQATVNTLRHDNVVLYNHISILRDKLDTLKHLKGFRSDEKDPEEFLNLLFKHVLNIEAFLQIKRPFGTHKEFFVQLLVEGDKHDIPRTQDLLIEMFREQQMTFAKYPLRLLLQIPNYGKQFKRFKGIIPSLELDVATLCEQYAGNCVKYHGAQGIPNTDVDDPGRLRLLSVLCIETSHYVCFTRVQGSGRNEWVFFDSMDERPDDVHYIPCVTQCTQQLNEWVYGDKDLTKYGSRELPPLVRRFIEDGYLCIYVDQDGIMYGDDGDTL